MSSTVGKEFMAGTRFKRLGPSDQALDLPRPPLEKPVDRSETPIDLPAPRTVQVKAVDVTVAINNRSSQRSYIPKPLSLEELSYLLWCTQGVKEVTRTPTTLRTVPSAGARHPLETYLLVNRVQGLAAGLYRFAAITHKLVALQARSGFAERFVEACLGQDTVSSSAVTFVWTAIPYRSFWRYHERAYRYVLLDAGHACENLYLAVQAIDAGCCAVGAFDDDAVNGLLGVDGEEEFAIYMAAVGKRL